VNLEAAESATKRIAALAKTTFSSGVLKEIGLFAGFFKLNLQAYPQPVLVSSIDGVGTKLKIAFMLDRHRSVGQDLVNHCVNDIMTCGSDPLFFLDYIGVGRLNPEHAVQVIEGMAQACGENECALIGGETAEMPGFYAAGEYDLAGAIVGVVNQPDIIDGARIARGDVLLGVPSTGLHTNGYSLARKILFEANHMDLQEEIAATGVSWADGLLAVHRSYRDIIRRVRRHPGLTGISHITGGGIVGNTIRLLRPGLQLQIDWGAWPIPPIFTELQRLGEVSDEEMRRVFNLGIGLVLSVRPEAREEIVRLLKESCDKAFEMGVVSEGVQGKA